MKKVRPMKSEWQTVWAWFPKFVTNEREQTNTKIWLDYLERRWVYSFSGGGWWEYRELPYDPRQ